MPNPTSRFGSMYDQCARNSAFSRAVIAHHPDAVEDALRNAS
jgi:hypothetical protein